MSSAALLPAPPRTTTMFACATTLLNTLLGVSVVGVSGGFARAGFAVGTCYLVLFGALAGSGLHLLARSSMTVSAAARRKADDEESEVGGIGKGVLPPSSFRAVALVGAPRWAFLIDVAVALKCFGVATSYLVVVGDLMPSAMSDIFGDVPADSMLLDRHVWVTVAFIVAAPLAFSRTLGALKYTATLAVGLVVFLVLMVLSFWALPGLDACPGGDETFASLDEAGFLTTSATAAEAEAFVTADGGSPPEAANTPTGIFDSNDEGFGGNDGACFEGTNAVGPVRSILQTLPIFVFCYTCHQNIFTICNEIVRPTPARVDAVIACAIAVALVTYLSLAWGAYATFGIGVGADLLETYPRTALLTTARICVSMLVISCYPLQAHPSRLCVLSTWDAFEGELKNAYSAVDISPGDTSLACSSPPLGAVNRDTPGTVVSGDDGSSSSASIGRSSSAAPARRANSDNLKRTASDSTSSGSNSSSSTTTTRREERGRKRVVSRDVDGGGGDAAAGPGTGASNIAGDVECPEHEGLLSGLGAGALSDDPPGMAAGVNGAQQSHEPTESSGDVGVEESGSARTVRHSGPGGGPVEDVRGEGEEHGGQDKKAFWTSQEGFRHILVTAVFLGLSYTIAMAVSDLGVLLEVVGATGSTTISFILPGLLYLKVHPEPHPKRSLAALQLVAGLFIIPVALTFIALGDSAEGRR